VAKKRTISGPGAADFLTAQGGIDFPETEPSKGTGITRDEGIANDTAQLEPKLDPEDEASNEKKHPTL